MQSSKRNKAAVAIVAMAFALFGGIRLAEAGLLSGVDPIHSYFAQNDPLAKYDPVMQYLFGKDKSASAAADAQSAINEATPAYCDAVAGQIAALKIAATSLVTQYSASQKKLIADTAEYNNLIGSTTAGTLFASTTADSGVQATTTSQVTVTTIATSSELAMFISPASASVGDLMTVNMDVLSAGITHYSLLTYENSGYIGKLIDNSAVPATTTRPFAFTKTFRLSPLTPSATFDFTLQDAQNPATFATSRLTVVTGSVAPGTIAFTQPWKNGLMHRNSSNLITWRGVGNATSPIVLKAALSCVRKVTFCPNSPQSSGANSCTVIQSSCKAGTSKTISIASGISPSQGSFAWNIPSTIVDVTAKITATQNGKVIGTSPNFYVSY